MTPTYLTGETWKSELHGKLGFPGFSEPGMHNSHERETEKNEKPLFETVQLITPSTGWTDLISLACPLIFSIFSRSVSEYCLSLSLRSIVIP